MVANNSLAPFFAKYKKTIVIAGVVALIGLMTYMSSIGERGHSPADAQKLKQPAARRKELSIVIRNPL
jgi:hypothetical protein